MSNDRCVGVINLFDVRERDYNDVSAFLAEAGRTVAGALRTAELLEGLRHGNTALRELVELSDRLNESGTVENLAREVAERLRELLAAEACDIWQVDDSLLRCLASVDGHGWNADDVGSERDLSDYATAAKALKTDEPMVVGDLEAACLEEGEKRAYRRGRFRSLVSLPLVVEGRAIALIDVFDVEARDFTVHLDLIRNVGRLLAGSFEKAMLVERLEQGNTDLRLLVESGLEFGATLDVDAVLRAVAERILDVAQADLCNVSRLDGDEIELVLAIGDHREVEPPGRRHQLAGYKRLQEAAEQRRPISCPDVLADPEMTPQDQADARSRGYRASLDVPLTSQGQVIGFISVMSRTTRDWAQADVIVGLAQIASQAIANAELYRRLDENLARVALLSESALELTGDLDLQTTLLNAAHRLCESVGVTECEIRLVEETGSVRLLEEGSRSRDRAA